MAVITIFVEGGVLENEHHSIQTLDNSQRLRESFYKLLTQRFNEQDFSLVVEIGGPNNQTIKFLKKELAKGENVYSTIDLDCPNSERNHRINELDLPDENARNRVFFMVQEMEAWILSQPEKIETFYSHLSRRKPNFSLKDDEILKGKHPKDITKPSDKLHTLLGRYFQIEKKGKKKKKKYKKLRDGADLLEILDYVELEQVFSDVKRLTDSLKNKT